MGHFRNTISHFLDKNESSTESYFQREIHVPVRNHISQAFQHALNCELKLMLISETP